MLKCIRNQSRSEHLPILNDLVRKVRSASADRAGYNASAERNLMGSRVGWLALLFACFVHILYGIHKRLYELAGITACISGMVNYALSVKPGGYLANFRDAIIEVMGKMVLLRRYVYCSAEALAFKELIVDIFCNDTHK